VAFTTVSIGKGGEKNGTRGGGKGAELVYLLLEEERIEESGNGEGLGREC